MGWRGFEPRRQSTLGCRKLVWVTEGFGFGTSSGHVASSTPTPSGIASSALELCAPGLHKSPCGIVSGGVEMTADYYGLKSLKDKKKKKISTYLGGLGFLFVCCVFVFVCVPYLSPLKQEENIFYGVWKVRFGA